MTRQLDLRFLESQDLPSGFTQFGMAGFRDINPSVIVREFIQNSHDALLDTRQRKAVVRFKAEEIQTADIPGIGSYKTAFKKAVQRREKENGGNLTDQEQIIADRIREALRRRKQNILIVSDNGIGLDKESMRAILADGMSLKKDGAGGAFGNGHLAPFPTSDLRYLLYAGINAGKWICSGHAVLASHRDGRTSCSANGYYINGHAGDAHKYSGKSQCPPLIKKVLHEIEEGSGHGTAVLVTAFNNFRDTKSALKDAIAEAAACSFFPAIYDGKLEIIVDTQDEEWTLNRANLQDALGKYREKKRNKDFLSGHKANASFDALSGNAEEEIEIMGGTVRVHVARPAPTGRTRVNLFRNGMWITNSDTPTGGIPCFYNQFGKYESFEALILVSAKTSREFHDLIRLAEGPRHNTLDLRAVSEKDQRKLRDAFASLRNWFRSQAREITDEPYSPSDFLSFPGDAGEDGAGRASGMSGVLTPFYRRAPGYRRHAGLGGTNERGQGKGKKTGKKRAGTRSGTRKRPVLPACFTAVATPQGQGRQKIRIHCMQDCDNLELRLFLNENQDPTTDRIWGDRAAKITSAVINGVPAADGVITNSGAPGLRLGSLKEDTDTEILLEVEIDGTMSDSGTSFRIEIEAVAEAGDEGEAG